MSVLERILVDDDVAEHPVTRRIVGLFPDADVRSSGCRQGADGTDPKRVLRLARHKGAFLKQWRTGPGEVSASRFYLAQGVGCPWDCEYCFLQSYHLEGVPRFHVNVEDLRAELLEKLPVDGPATVHVGELTDATFLDRATGLSAILHDVAAERANVTFELRTKSDDVSALAKLAPLENFQVAWTMSPPDVAEEIERGAPSIGRRVRAVKRMVYAGHKVGLRFDPVIRVDGWERRYEDMVERISRDVTPASISGVGVGLLRFSPALPECVRRRHGLRKIFLEEFVRCADGKMRYFKFFRVQMFRVMIEAIGEFLPGAPVAIAGETPEVRELLRARIPEEAAVGECCR